MSSRFGLMGLDTTEDQYLTGRPVMYCADETAAQVDQEVKEMLSAAYDKALEMLGQNRDVLDKIADFLINRETITGKEFMEILRRTKKDTVVPASKRKVILV